MPTPPWAAVALKRPLVGAQGKLGRGPAIVVLQKVSFDLLR